MRCVPCGQRRCFFGRGMRYCVVVCTGCHEAVFGRGVRNHQTAYDRCVMNSEFLALITDDMDGGGRTPLLQRTEHDREYESNSVTPPLSSPRFLPPPPMYAPRAISRTSQPKHSTLQARGQWILYERRAEVVLPAGTTCGRTRAEAAAAEVGQTTENVLGIPAPPARVGQGKVAAATRGPTVRRRPPEGLAGTAAASRRRPLG